MSDETTEAAGKKTAPENRTPVVRTVEVPAGQRAHAAVLAARVPTKLAVDLFVVGRSDAGACVTPGMVLARDQRFLLLRVPGLDDKSVLGAVAAYKKKPSGDPWVKGIDYTEYSTATDLGHLKSGRGKKHFWVSAAMLSYLMMELLKKYARSKPDIFEDQPAVDVPGLRLFFEPNFHGPAEFVSAAATVSVVRPQDAATSLAAASKTPAFRTQPKPVVQDTSTEIDGAMPRELRRGDALEKGLEDADCVVRLDLLPRAKEEWVVLKLDELRGDGTSAIDWGLVRFSGLKRALGNAFGDIPSVVVGDGSQIHARLVELDRDADALAKARRTIAETRARLAKMPALGGLEDGTTLVEYVRRLANLPELDPAALPDNARPLKAVLATVDRVVTGKLRTSVIVRTDADLKRVLEKNDEGYAASVVGRMTASERTTAREEVLVSQLMLESVKRMIAGHRGVEIYSVCLAGDGGTGVAPGGKSVPFSAWQAVIAMSATAKDHLPPKICGYARKVAAEAEREGADAEKKQDPLNWVPRRPPKGADNTACWKAYTSVHRKGIMDNIARSGEAARQNKTPFALASSIMGKEWDSMDAKAKAPYVVMGQQRNAEKITESKAYAELEACWNSRQKALPACRKAMLREHQPELPQTRNWREVMFDEIPLDGKRSLPEHARYALSQIQAASPAKRARHEATAAAERAALLPLQEAATIFSSPVRRRGFAVVKEQYAAARAQFGDDFVVPDTISPYTTTKPPRRTLDMAAVHLEFNGK